MAESSFPDIAMGCHAGRVYLAAKIMPVGDPRDVHAAMDFLRLWAPHVVELEPDTPVTSENYLLLFEDDSIYIFTADAPDSFHPNFDDWLALEGREFDQESTGLFALKKEANA